MDFEKHLIANYAKMVRYSNYQAFKFNLNKDDLLSLVNEKISIRLSRDKMVWEDQKQFWSYLYRIIYSACIDLVRPSVKTVELFDNDIMPINWSIERQLTYRIIIARILADIKNPVHLQIFTEVFIHGEKYGDTAEKLGVSMSVVKNIIFRTRQDIVENYRQSYYIALT